MLIPEIMGLFRHHNLNQGMHIDGNGKSIDIILRGVRRLKDYREVDLEILGVPEMSSLCINSDDGLVKIIDGIKVGIRNNARRKGRAVPFHYCADSIYCLTHREYD